jgi:hypothetical protein
VPAERAIYSIDHIKNCCEHWHISGPYEPIFEIFLLSWPFATPIKGFSNLKHPQVRFEKLAILTLPGRTPDSG